MSFDFPLPPELDDPILGFRFVVFFMGKLMPSHLLDFRFQSVEGLSQRLKFDGDSSEFPTSLEKGRLKLKRGLPMISTYRMEIRKSFEEFKFKPRNVLVSILDDSMLPVSNWIFREAYPIEWSLSGIDASNGQVIIESLELTYSSVKSISL